MRKIVTVAVVGLALAGCTTTQRYAGTGALVGAAVAPKYCWTRDRYGNRIRVRC